MATPKEILEEICKLRCCQEQIDYPTIICKADCADETGEVSVRWLTSMHDVEIFYIKQRERGETGWNNIPEPKFCTYCGEPVPKLVKKKNPPSHCVYTDGGYYCNNCGERLQCCSCLPPEAAWECEK